MLLVKNLWTKMQVVQVEGQFLLPLHESGDITFSKVWDVDQKYLTHSQLAPNSVH